MIRAVPAWLLAASLAAEGLDGLSLADGRVLVGTWDPERRLLTLPGEGLALAIDPRDVRRLEALPFERTGGRWRVPAWRWLERTAPERDPYGLVAWSGGYTTRPLAARYRREDGERAADAADRAARRRVAELGRPHDADLERTLAAAGRLMAALSDGSEAEDGVACAMIHGAAVPPPAGGDGRRGVLRAVAADALALARAGTTWTEVADEAVDLGRLSEARGAPLAASAAVAAVLAGRAARSGRSGPPPVAGDADRWVLVVLGDDAPPP